MADEWWVLVADGGSARCFATSVPGEALRELQDWVNPPARISDHDLERDARGRTLSGAGGGGHGLEPPLDAHDKADRQFARRLADRLDQAVAQQQVRQLALVAPARFLGELRAVLSPECRSRCALEVPRDLVHHPLQDIRRCLKEALHPG